MADRVVLDASVAVKWFLKDSLETDTDLADDILVAMLAGDLEVHAPRISCYEVGGVLTRACLTKDPVSKTPRITKADAVQCLRDFLDLPIEMHDTSPDEAARALEMAVDYNKTHWDMIYVHLAQQLGCQWLTADESSFKPSLPGFRYSLSFVSRRCDSHEAPHESQPRTRQASNTKGTKATKTDRGEQSR